MSITADRILNRTQRLFSASFKLVLVTIFVFPFLWMMITAFKTFDETIVFPPSLWPAEIQWQNFVEVWNSGPYPLFVRNSIVVTLSIVVMQLAVMIPAAYGFAKYQFRFKGPLFALVLVAFMIPGQVTFISVYLMFARMKLLKTLVPQILPFGANAFGIFLLRQAFMQVPEEIVESARLDSAKELQILFSILLPMARSSMVTVAMFSFIAHWNDFFWPFVMTNTTEVRPLPIAIAGLRNIEGAYAWHIIMAGNVILVLPIILVYVFLSKQIITAFMYRGIK